MLADENLNNDLVRALRRVRPDIALVTVREAGLCGIDDPRLLEIAADGDLVLLTHDVKTMVGFSRERVATGWRMAGLIVVPTVFHVANTVDDLLLILDCSLDDELVGQVCFLPL